jgi:hypothetical protein
LAAGLFGKKNTSNFQKKRKKKIRIFFPHLPVEHRGSTLQARKPTRAPVSSRSSSLYYAPRHVCVVRTPGCVQQSPRHILRELQRGADLQRQFWHRRDDLQAKQ